MRSDRRTSLADRRKGPRAPMVVGVVKRVGRGVELAQTINIGLRGVTLMRTADGAPHEPATRVRLEFQLPGETEPLALDGEVVFDRAATVDGRPWRTTGVRFTPLDATTAVRIARYVTRSRVPVERAA